ncbi:hypothetical protein OPV22_008337 [Ensete ventricosum]|uniref:SURF1-like protein n=1 Tax=Ensete ventricosum TaxID=4639 RepID=A0AAV8PNZ9_ENSVE|nr:hypothetical protein OPV22_008337 [Ensete ventricosum]
MSIKWAIGRRWDSNCVAIGLIKPKIEAFNKDMLALRPQVEHIVSVGDASFFYMAASLSKTLRLKRSLLSVVSSPRLTPLSAFFSSQAPTPPPTYAAASSGSQSQEKERGKWSKALLFLPGAITFGLGTWQLFRRQEKKEMLDYRRKRLEMEPLKWNKLSSSDHDFDSLEFRKVFCEGDFDESKSVYVGPRSRSISGVIENGFYVITPLVPKDNWAWKLPVLVNRGWVPRGWRKKLENSENSGRSSSPEIVDAKPNEGSAWWKFWSKEPSVTKVEENSTAPTRVIGVVRGSEKPSIFVPENDPSSDINEDVSASNPYPIPKDVNTLIRYSVMPQDHLNYTFTWYSLSAAVTYMALLRGRIFILQAMAVAFHNLNGASGLQKLNDYLLTRSYITGYQASKDDIAVYGALNASPSSDYINVARWYNHIDALLKLCGISEEGKGVKMASFDEAPCSSVADGEASAVEDDDDDMDLFGEETEEEKKAAEERAAAVKASGKKKESGKSSVLLDVKPWDDETDMQKLEEAVRSVRMEGLLWGASKLAPVGAVILWHSTKYRTVVLLPWRQLKGPGFTCLK